MAGQTLQFPAPPKIHTLAYILPFFCDKTLRLFDPVSVTSAKQFHGWLCICAPRFRFHRLTSSSVLFSAALYPLIKESPVVQAQLLQRDCKRFLSVVRLVA